MAMTAAVRTSSVRATLILLLRHKLRLRRLLHEPQQEPEGMLRATRVTGALVAGRQIMRHMRQCMPKNT